MDPNEENLWTSIPVHVYTGVIKDQPSIGDEVKDLAWFLILCAVVVALLIFA